jgi:hypothetical protein
MQCAKVDPELINMLKTNESKSTDKRGCIWKAHTTKTLGRMTLWTQLKGRKKVSCLDLPIMNMQTPRLE